MTNEEIIEFQRKEREWRSTPLGAAFVKMTNAASRAWVYDTESGFRENASDRRLREVWEAERAATAAFRALLDEQASQHADLLEALIELLPEGWGKDDTMDHMPGVKKARLAIAKAGGMPQ